MNPWPRASDFALMLQEPRIAFKDPQLLDCKIHLGKSGQPHGIAGAAAVVFRATTRGGRDVALKVFTRPALQRNERYRRIADYLSQCGSIKALQPVELVVDGIRALDGKFYPVLIMDWIPGNLLYTWLGRQCAAENREELKRVSQVWLALIDEMAAADIAHGDFQHGNILITDEGLIRLTDYDSMYVPELSGLRNAEMGTKPYRHPGRNKDTVLSLVLDRYPALFIYVVLRVLAVEPRLWKKYVDQTRYDRLLIRQQDLAKPGTSSLYRDILELSDPELTRLTKSLFDLYHADFDSVPPLGEVYLSSKRSPSCPSPDGPLVFISAKSDDFGLARKVYDFLASHGVNAFLSDVTLRQRGNSDYLAEIDRALDEAKHMIVVASSPKHVQSTWVSGEWRLFINEKRSGRKNGNLVTVVTDDVEPHDLPASLRYFEVLPLNVDLYDKLVNYVR